MVPIDILADENMKGQKGAIRMEKPESMKGKKHHKRRQTQNKR